MIDWIRTNREKLADILFFLAYGIYLTVNIINVSFVMSVLSWTAFKIILAFCMGLILVREALVPRLDKKSILVFLGAVVFCIYMWDLKIWYIPAAFMIVSARDILFDRIARLTIWISLISVAVIAFCAEMGWITNVISITGDRIRDYLGFRYALFASNILCNVTFLCVYLWKDKINWWGFAGILLANFVIYYMTDSRIALILALLALGMSVLMKFRPGIFYYHRGIRKAMSWSYVVWAIVGIPLMMLYTSRSKLWIKFDELLSFRVSFPAKAYHKVGFHLLPDKDFVMIGGGLDLDGSLYSNAYNYIDNLYLQILLLYGIILLVLYLVLNTAIMRKLVDREPRGYLLMLFSMLALQAFIQDSWWFLWYNTFLFVVVDVWWNKETAEELPPLPPRPAKQPKARSEEELLIEKIALEARR